MHLKNLLSKNDAICLLELIQKSFLCSKEEDLRNLISDLKILIPFDHAVCLLGKKGISDNVSSYNALNVSFPSEWFDLYVMKNFHKIDPIVKENFLSFALQYWADTYKKYNPPKDFIMAAEDFDLKKGYSYGIRNYRGTEGSLFSFAGNSIECNRRTEIILTHMIPALHQALSAIVTHRTKKHIAALSQREKEILAWVGYGKRTWDISVILGISERTVKFHIRNIMQKLDVVTRAQAVAVAIEQGLLDIE
mgnify:FL=1